MHLGRGHFYDMTFHGLSIETKPEKNYAAFDTISVEFVYGHLWLFFIQIMTSVDNTPEETELKSLNIPLGSVRYGNPKSYIEDNEWKQNQKNKYTGFCLSNYCATMVVLNPCQLNQYIFQKNTPAC